MKKYRVAISSYIIVRADSEAEAGREVEAIKEALADRVRLPSDEERDLMLNGEITSVEEEIEDNE